MKLEWLVFAALVAGALTATVHQRRQGARDIPVQVVYDAPAVRNLDVKPQLPTESKPAGIKNLEAKPQLSTEEAKDVLKNLPPSVDDANKVKIVTPDQSVELVQPIQPIASAAYQQGEENIDDIYDKIQEIINNGAKKIQTDFEKIPDNEHKQEVLKKVNTTLEEFLESTRKLIEIRNIQTLKQDAGVTTGSPLPNPANIFQQIIGSFQTFSSSLFSGLNPSGQPGVQSEGSTAAPTSPFPNPLQLVQNAISQMQGNLGALFGARPPSAQSDETTGTNPQNPLQFIQQQFSNIFQRPTAAPGTQSDEQPAQTNPIVGFVQGAISNVQNVFNPSTAAPAAHDEVVQGAASTAAPAGNNPLQFIQNAGQNVISALQNNPLFPGSQTTAAPASAAALAAATTATPNPALAVLNQAQTQLNQVVPNNPLQQQGQQAIALGTAQANQVVAQLTPQGLPGSEQINTVLNTAQQIPGNSATTAKPVNVPTLTAASVPKAPAADDIAEDVPADEVGEDAIGETEAEIPAKLEEPIPKAIKVEPSKVEEPIKEEISNEVFEEKKEVTA